MFAALFSVVLFFIAPAKHGASFHHHASPNGGCPDTVQPYCI
jgi:hypothetical protein